MMLERWLKPRRPTLSGRALFAHARAGARRPAFYRAGTPDTPEGRFELYTLHVVLLLHRLKGQGPEATETAQALFDAFLKDLDEGLRDMGVGDLSVGKKMRKLGEAVYGRIKGYDAALAALPDEAMLRALVARTLLPGDGTDSAQDAIVRYIVAASEALAAWPLERLLAGDLEWPAFGGSESARAEAAHEV